MELCLHSQKTHVHNYRMNTIGTPTVTIELHGLSLSSNTQHAHSII